ncbi:phage tail assembly chaperone [Thiorhodococcus fuscus]|uniref:Uncharacterized protein n=1 Tax=Thiorhodococcus fuscus TaxID=527200 RepID=A0ABW4YBH7_9GAMM
MHSVPDPKDRKRGGEDRRTRRQRLDSAERDTPPPELDMPPLEPEAAPYLDLLFEVGPTEPGEYGHRALSWRELESWQRQTGQRLMSAEVRMIRRLSAVYASAAQEMRAHDAMAPWPDRDPVERSVSVDSSLENLFAALSKRQDRNAP